ncbi:hypothetical protein Airi02_063220 [Actinoallomurus iriomotensis]|uniref:Uncharacterized protein n=1 Tax=Actinoallomurus iriomotensis TaxID=478107 RepID=A0A9W6S781_9ACTN|nr:hypothetical protein Airi02_063220 [Actinoallomurus iriomotensis]
MQRHEIRSRPEPLADSTAVRSRPSARLIAGEDGCSRSAAPVTLPSSRASSTVYPEWPVRYYAWVLVAQTALWPS